MTTDKARFETDVCLKPIPKMNTSTIVKGDKLDSETEDDGGDLVDFGENCWRKIPTATKKGLHVIGKMPTGMFFTINGKNIDKIY